MLPADPVLLAQRISALLAAAGTTHRVIIGVAGAPGAGKSTFAAKVADACGPAATLVAMDGFHLAQRVLDDLGLAEIKGAPETFDADGYLALLARLAREPDGAFIYAPEFRRSIEEPIAGAVPVPPSARVVITEGNYLLLDTPPWDRVRSLATEVWFLDTPETVRLEWLISRHVAFGRSPDSARDRAVHGSDGRNAALVLTSRDRADVILRP